MPGHGTNTPHRLTGVFDNPGEPKIAVIGCGGTGSLLAEMLCRLLIGTPATLLLADPDEVEPHNLLRQNFLPEDVGRNKARALSDRLSKQFNRSIGHWDHDFAALTQNTHYPRSYGLTIGCVDNALARAEMQTITNQGNWLMDCGNSREHGQVLLGNVSRDAFMQSVYQGQPTPFFYEGRCHFLPSPASQEPDLLTPGPEDSHHDRDCGQAVLLQEQSPLVNQAMALAAAQLTYKLLTRSCAVMGLYLNIASGQLRAVPATPGNAARALGLTYPEDLME